MAPVNASSLLAFVRTRARPGGGRLVERHTERPA